ncbi:Uncharacterized protein dnm_052580 [Desulfonema magnum]|uniref:Uncharacterized protein n=1 Tax=Desulfonema magnum TaxID=45655 RepID=A0A975BPX8_9BACT|nr:Uncharacterized protein dnm_052580 [Desulfonema magnum]
MGAFAGLALWLLIGNRQKRKKEQKSPPNNTNTPCKLMQVNLICF